MWYMLKNIWLFPTCILECGSLLGTFNSLLCMTRIKLGGEFVSMHVHLIGYVKVVSHDCHVINITSI